MNQAEAKSHIKVGDHIFTIPSMNENEKKELNLLSVLILLYLVTPELRKDEKFLGILNGQSAKISYPPVMYSDGFGEVTRGKYRDCMVLTLTGMKPGVIQENTVLSCDEIQCTYAEASALLNCKGAAISSEVLTPANRAIKDFLTFCNWCENHRKGKSMITFHKNTTKAELEEKLEGVCECVSSVKGYAEDRKNLFEQLNKEGLIRAVENVYELLPEERRKYKKREGEWLYIKDDDPKEKEWKIYGKILETDLSSVITTFRAANKLLKDKKETVTQQDIAGNDGVSEQKLEQTIKAMENFKKFYKEDFIHIMENVHEFLPEEERRKYKKKKDGSYMKDDDPKKKDGKILETDLLPVMKTLHTFHGLLLPKRKKEIVIQDIAGNDSVSEWQLKQTIEAIKNGTKEQNLKIATFVSGSVKYGEACLVSTNRYFCFASPPRRRDSGELEADGGDEDRLFSRGIEKEIQQPVVKSIFGPKKIGIYLEHLIADNGVGIKEIQLEEIDVTDLRKAFKAAKSNKSLEKISIGRVVGFEKITKSNVEEFSSFIRDSSLKTILINLEQHDIYGDTELAVLCSGSYMAKKLKEYGLNRDNAIDFNEKSHQHKASYPDSYFSTSNHSSQKHEMSFDKNHPQYEFFNQLEIKKILDKKALEIKKSEKGENIEKMQIAIMVAILDSLSIYEASSGKSPKYAQLLTVLLEFDWYRKGNPFLIKDEFSFESNLYNALSCGLEKIRKIVVNLQGFRGYTYCNSVKFIEGKISENLKIKGKVKDNEIDTNFLKEVFAEVFHPEVKLSAAELITVMSKFSGIENAKHGLKLSIRKVLQLMDNGDNMSCYMSEEEEYVIKKVYDLFKKTSKEKKEEQNPDLYCATTVPTTYATGTGASGYGAHSCYK